MQFNRTTMEQNNTPVTWEIQALIKNYTDQKAPQLTISHHAYKKLHPATKKLIREILKRYQDENMAPALEDNLEKIEFYLQLIEEGLQEARCRDMVVASRINSVRNHIHEALQKPIASDDEFLFLRKLGLTNLEILRMASTTQLSEAATDLMINFGAYRKIFGTVRNIANQLKLPNGHRLMKERLVETDENYSFHFLANSENLEMEGLSIPQLESLKKQKNGQEKVEYLETHQDLLSRLTDWGFTTDLLIVMMKKPSWKTKIAPLENQEFQQELQQSGFTGPQIYQILKSPHWQELINYLETPGVIPELQATGFHAAYLTKILVTPDWQDKIEFLLDLPPQKSAKMGKLKHLIIVEILERDNWKTVLMSYLDYCGSLVI